MGKSYNVMDIVKVFLKKSTPINKLNTFKSYGYITWPHQFWRKQNRLFIAHTPLKIYDGRGFYYKNTYPPPFLLEK